MCVFAAAGANRELHPRGVGVQGECFHREALLFLHCDSLSPSAQFQEGKIVSFDPKTKQIELELLHVSQGTDCFISGFWKIIQ